MLLLLQRQLLQHQALSGSQGPVLLPALGPMALLHGLHSTPFQSEAAARRAAGLLQGQLSSRGPSREAEDDGDDSGGEERGSDGAMSDGELAAATLHSLRSSGGGGGSAEVAAALDPRATAVATTPVKGVISRGTE